MDFKEEILNILLDSYERSGYIMPGKTSNRKIAMSPTQLAGYKENSYSDVMRLNEDVKEMARLELVSYCWKKGYNEKLIGKICLNLSSAENTFKLLHRKPVINRTEFKLNIIGNTKKKIHTKWIQEFLSDEEERLKEKLKTSRLFPMDEKHAVDICKLLSYIDKKSALIRIISVQCFNDSKYIKRELQRNLISIAKKYEPEIAIYKSDEDNHLSDRQILEQIGIIVYPEIFEFCGIFSAVIGGQTVDFSPFNRGYCLQSEMIDKINSICFDGIKNIILVENRTNYRQMILNGIEKETIIVHHGGFYSPSKGLFFKLLYENANDSIRFFFWGDIDLGGFTMYDRLKRNIISTLIPCKMDKATFEKAKKYGMKRTDSYLYKIEQYKNDIFNEVIDCILSEKVTIEQECLM